MDQDTPNPLLEGAHFDSTDAEHQPLPAFARIQPEHVVPAVETLLSECRALVAHIETNDETPTWENLAAPLEAVLDRLHRAWSPVSHLHSVADSEPLRDAYNAALPLLTAHSTDLGQNRELHERYRRLAAAEDFERLDVAHRRAVTNALQDFELAGVALDEADKARFKEIAGRLATLSSRFQENVLDASNAWSLHLSDRGRLSGVPESVLEQASEAARRDGKSGWLLSLEIPCYIGIVTHADDRALREEIYLAYCTRASDQGPHAGQWDNTEVMAEILALRHEQARLLDKANYAELSLARKMAPSTDEVMRFLDTLASHARPAAAREFETLSHFAAQELGIEQLAAHDVAYCAEKFRVAHFALSQEDLRPYFPAPKVIGGLFAIAGKLFNIEIAPATIDAQVWHPDVALYEIRAATPGDANQGGNPGELIGRFYLDLYARPHKRGGAWMDECVVRRRDPDGLQLPVAYLTCNFTPPVADRPALLTHDEVTTLFHEFGHGLHHLLTRVELAAVSGINGVAWDAVELPSQLMENWCWEREALDLLSGHHKTGEPLPADLYDRLSATRTFQAGMQTVRQLEFALFDFRIHLEYDPNAGPRIWDILAEVRDAVSVVPVPPSNRFAHGFSHIFGGGYAAGYYSYKWAEALSADAYSMFEENGIFDARTGEAFKKAVLEQGGTRDAMDLFKEFRGREPTVDALLRQCGFNSDAPSPQASQKRSGVDTDLARDTAP